MFDIAYEAEANIEAARIIMDKEWEKSKGLKNLDSRAIYLGISCYRAASAFEYWNIIFLTHGGF